MWVASNTCGLIQLRFSNVTNEVQVGDLVEAMLVLDDVKLTSKAQEIVNGCVTWTPSPPFRAFLERFVLAVEKFMIESKHINQAFATCFFYSIFLIEGLEHFPHILGRSIPINLPPPPPPQPLKSQLVGPLKKSKKVSNVLSNNSSTFISISIVLPQYWPQASSLGEKRTL